jgi:hypothetical protein
MSRDGWFLSQQSSWSGQVADVFAFTGVGIRQICVLLPLQGQVRVGLGWLGRGRQAGGTVLRMETFTACKTHEYQCTTEHSWTAIGPWGSRMHIERLEVDGHPLKRHARTKAGDALGCTDHRVFGRAGGGHYFEVGGDAFGAMTSVSGFGLACSPRPRTGDSHQQPGSAPLTLSHTHHHHSSETAARLQRPQRIAARLQRVQSSSPRSRPCRGRCSTPPPPPIRGAQAG